jgi:hypothetical protein
MRLSQVFAGLSLVVLLGTCALASEPIHISATLKGFDEVPSKSTTGQGTFRATIDETAQTITFTLTFSGLSGPPIASHIHFAQKDVNGGIQVFFCDGAGHTACPTGTSGTITGTVTAADVIATAPDQGIEAGQFDKLVHAILAGKTYVNIHTVQFPGGEIRGQIKKSDDSGDDDR